jgi:hypothetical protein
MLQPKVTRKFLYHKSWYVTFKVIKEQIYVYFFLIPHTFEAVILQFLAVPNSSDSWGTVVKPCLTFNVVNSSWNNEKL